MKKLLLSVVAVLALAVCLAPSAFAQPDADQSKIVAVEKGYTDVPKAGGGVISVDANGKAVAETFPYKAVQPVIGKPLPAVPGAAVGKGPSLVKLIYHGGDPSLVVKMKAKPNKPKKSSKRT